MIKLKSIIKAFRMLVGKCIVMSLLIFLFMLMQSKMMAQDKPTDFIKISGLVKHDTVLQLKDLAKLSSSTIQDIDIKDHSGSVKKTMHGLKGVLIKSILEPIIVNVEKPKFYNEFYFVFKASDNYKVVFSWNEIFNTVIGDSLFVITEENSKSVNESPERMMLISTKDIKSGRRYIKNLEEIVVKRIE